MPNSINIADNLSELFTIRDFLRFGASNFNAAKIYFGHGTDNAWDDAVALVLHALSLPHDINPNILDARLTYSERENILRLFLRRINERVPVPYLTHEAWFASLPFYVDERVLIPRSPFAEIIEKRFAPWVDDLEVMRILDIGTGSACMAIACALAFPESLVDAVDLSNDALEVAKINVDKHNVRGQVRFLQSDVFSALPNEKYDIIISNPPYVGTEEMQTLPPEYAHEPRSALLSGEHGLDVVKKILQEAAQHLNSEGLLFVEVGNSEDILAEQFPEVPFLWLEFERGGGGVFMLTKEQLNFTGS